MVETLTPEMIDQMPAGPEMNALIEAEIFGAVPLTNDEWDLFRASWAMAKGPHDLNGMIRPLKVPIADPEYYTKLYFRLDWPRDYSSDTYDAPRKVVNKMRDDGWLYELYDGSQGVRVVRFIHKESMGKYRGDAIAETEALAICRAALSAKLALNKRGEK